MMIRVASAHSRNIVSSLASVQAYAIAVLLIGAAVVSAQDRPWRYRSATLPGPVPKVRQAASALVIFDTVAYRTIDHGATLDSLTGLEGEICEFFDFSPGISFAITYEAASRTAKVFFWQGGNVWNKVDSLANVARPTSGIASGMEWYMATENGATIHRIGEKTSTIKGPSSEPIRQLLLLGTTLVANVAGRQISYTTDMGTSWRSVPVVGLGPIHIVNDAVFAASAQGIMRLDLEKASLEQVGKWTLPSGQIPATLEVDSHAGQLYAITSDSSYRMFRLDPASNTWTRWGYPLPSDQAAASPSFMSIESGWAVVALNITGEKKDTSGIYAYDLNDFTSLDDEQTDLVAQGGLFIHEDVVSLQLGNEIAHAQLYDGTGQCVRPRIEVHSGVARLELIGLPKGVYLLLGHHPNGSATRRLILR